MPAIIRMRLSVRLFNLSMFPQLLKERLMGVIRKDTNIQEPIIQIVLHWKDVFRNWKVETQLQLSLRVLRLRWPCFRHYLPAIMLSFLMKCIMGLRSEARRAGE